MSRYLLPKWFCVESAITWKIPAEAVSHHCSQKAGSALSWQSSRDLGPGSSTQEADFGTLLSMRGAGSTVLGTLPQSHSQQSCLQHWGHRYWDGWWSHLAQAGVCLRPRCFLCLPWTLRPWDEQGMPSSDLSWPRWCCLCEEWPRFSRNPQSQTWQN